MAQIKNFKSKKEKIKDWLNDAVDNILQDGYDKIIIGCTSEKSPIVLTAYYGCDVGDKQVLNSHIQIDIIDQTIKANINNYMDFVE